MGVRHFIRQIKQPSFRPDLYTHVYVIVPLNQETGNIKDGYLIIDGTTSNNREPIYTMAHDTELNLPHYGLNAPKNKAVATKRKNVATKGKTVATKSCNKKVALGIGALLAGVFLFGKK